MLRAVLIRVTALLLLFALSGCDWLPFGYTAIKDIQAAPAQYEGKQVKLHGTVTGSLKLPVIDLKGYTLRDDTGEVAVLTKGSLPPTNARVALTGIVKSVAIVGGQSLGLRVEEVKRLYEEHGSP